MKILITGGSGFLASRVGEYFQKDESCCVLMPSHSEHDITDIDCCNRWFEENRPDAVIHLAAISDIRECAENEELSKVVNTQGPITLATCFKSSGAKGRFLFASSDQVYTGNRTSDRLNKETDTLDPQNLYALEKLEAEEKVSAILSDAIALRLPWMFDLKPGKQDFIKNIVQSIRKQEPAKFAVNELRGETYALEIAENMKKMLLSDAPGGAYNFGGLAFGNSYETALAAYELVGKALNATVDGLVLPVTYENPRSLAMDQTKINSVGISFRNTVESVAYCLKEEAEYLA